ncbi:hypothetical protein GOP47_0002399 [Adiantum capillus-veneris]|uniref:Uncharacterized protein n=1 Tax=Adiantum capillus-veneris TaxID=13818 RepID=A0A9D4VBI2_ADICA|nr:hypothetical protein GOP47_0002399 [Adiantum capillus-veneris]
MYVFVGVCMLLYIIYTSEAYMAETLVKVCVMMMAYKNPFYAVVLKLCLADKERDNSLQCKARQSLVAAACEGVAKISLLTKASGRPASSVSGELKDINMESCL